MYWGRHEEQGREYREQGRGWRGEGERGWERERRQWRQDPRDWERERFAEESRRDWLEELRDLEREEQRRRGEWPGPESWERGPHAGPGREFREREWRPPGYAQADYGREAWAYGYPGAWRERRREMRHRERGGEDWSGGWMGWRRERRFENRGPKGYKRSDKRIMEDVCDEFMIDDRLDPREIEVEVLDGVVILRGTVNRRYEKYLAEDIADSVLGVKDVDNRLRISAERELIEPAERERVGSRESGARTPEASSKPAEAASRPPEGT